MARFRLLRVLTRSLSITLLVSVAAAGAHGAELSGTVVGPDGEPVAGALVQIVAGEWRGRTVTSNSGAFHRTVPDTVIPPLTVIVSGTPFADASRIVTDPTEPVRVELRSRAVFTDEVEVTTTRAEPGETPVTATNVTREQIEREHWGQDLPMFLSQVPGFYAYNDGGHGIGYSYFTLRGFDMRRTAVSINGVPLNDAERHGAYFVDLADFLATTGDIQVQRGVGTTPYGGAAIGGAVDINTRAPLPQRRLRVSSVSGSWGTSRRAVQYDTGLSDDGRWAAVFRYSEIDTDGYRDQSWVEMWNYFLTVERYGERSTLQLNMFGGPEDTHLAFIGIPKRYLQGRVTGDRRRDRRHNPLTYPGEVDEFFQPHVQLIHTWHVQPSIVLENTLFYFEGDGAFTQLVEDAALADYGLPSLERPGGDPITTTDLVRDKTIDEWDGGLISTLEWTHDGERGRLQAGAAIRLHRGRHWGEVVWAESYPPDVGPDHRYYDYEAGKHTYQPFVQETWRPNERWTLFGGLTWTHHRYEMGEDRVGDVDLEETYGFPIARLGATFHASPGWSVFANLSRAGREPALRDIYNPENAWSERVELEEERVTDVELGGEHRWSDGFAKLNLYWMHFDNEIVWAGGLDDIGAPITANGAVSDHRGLEIELGWTPRQRIGAHLAASYSDNTFDEFIEYDSTGQPIEHSGNRIAGHPDWLATLQLKGGWGPVDGFVTVRHVGRIYLDNTEDMRKFPEIRNDAAYIHRVNPAFTTMDLALEIDLGRRITDLMHARRAALDVRINNLADELHTSFGYMGWTEPLWIPAATRSIYTGLTIDW